MTAAEGRIEDVEPARVTDDAQVDIGLLGQTLAETTGEPVRIVATGVAPTELGPTTYEVGSVSPAVLADAVTNAGMPDRGRAVLLAAAADLEEVAAGRKLWPDVPNGDKVLAAALLVAIDAVRSAPALTAIDGGKPCVTARETAARRRNGT